MSMIRGWYHNKNNGQHLLPVGKIADACGISLREVKAWFVDKIHQPTPTGGGFIDAADVVNFLAKNDLPVIASLLPPNTRKILFICENEAQLEDNFPKFGQICGFLSSGCNILFETSTAGKMADLSVLTFCPDLTVIYLKTCNQELINTFRLATNFPEQKTIFLVDDGIRADVERDLGEVSQSHLVMSDSLPFELLMPQLHVVFDNR